MTRSLKELALKELALVLAALALSIPAVAAQSSVPKLDLGMTCRPLDRSDFAIQIDTDRCLKTENEARQKLAEEWTQHSAADRNLCTQTARMGGVESYVQLLTCLELQRDAVAERSEPRIDASSPAGRPMTERPAGMRR
jgi:hypothetical protein